MKNPNLEKMQFSQKELFEISHKRRASSASGFAPEVSSRTKFSTKLRFPPMYSLLFLNDNYTPMDFVKRILMTYCALGSDEAEAVVWEIHSKGQAQVGIFTKDVAETKLRAIVAETTQHQHPLMVKISPLPETEA